MLATHANWTYYSNSYSDNKSIKNILDSTNDYIYGEVDVDLFFLHV